VGAHVPIASKDNMMKPCHPYINQSTQQREKTRNKMEGTSYKKTNEPPQKDESQREHQVPKPPSCREKHIKERKERITKLTCYPFLSFSPH
jgi:hypothetical protein